MGKPRFSKDRLYDDAAPVGVVMGLAWTSMGGAALYVEATKLSGGDKGAPKLSTTGQLGSVMEEVDAGRAESREITFGGRVGWR